MTKEYKIQPKLRHKKLANEVIKQGMTTGKVNKGKAMRDAGFPESMSKNPKQVFESKGFRAVAIQEGLTEINIAKWLFADIESNAGKRVPELTLTTKLLGMHEEKLNVDLTQNTTVGLLRGLLDASKEEKEQKEIL